MSKKGKVIGALIGVVLAGAGGIAGGVALANQNMDQQIADAKEEAYQEGFDKGQSSNPGGYTEEDLQNAKDEGMEELQEEYATVFAILATQDRSEIGLNDNIILYSSYNQDATGLIAYSKTDNKFYTLSTTGYGYIECGRINTDVGEMLMVSSSSENTPGLFGITEDLEMKTYATRGYNYQQVISNGDELLAICYGIGDYPFESSLVKIGADGQLTSLITSQFGGGVWINADGQIAYESNSQNAYVSTSFGEYTKIDGVDVTIRDGGWMIDSMTGQGIMYFTNEDGKIAIYDFKSGKYYSTSTSYTMFTGVLGYSYDNDTILCSVYDDSNGSAIVSYDFSTGTVKTLFTNLMNGQWFESGIDEMVLMTCGMDNKWTISSFSYSSNEVTTYFEGVNDAYLVSIGENNVANVHVGFFDDTGEHQYIINLRNDESTQVF